MALSVTTLPWEDMLGVGGWSLYLFAAILLGGACIMVGYWAIKFWIMLVRLFVSNRNVGSSLEGIALLMIMKTLFFTVAFLVLMLAFSKMVVCQNVQVIRFGDDALTLVYRFPWLDQRIAYGSITGINMADDPPLLGLPGVHPRGGFPVTVVIHTGAREYDIGAGPARWRKTKAKAIYNQLLRHLSPSGNPST